MPVPSAPLRGIGSGERGLFGVFIELEEDGAFGMWMPMLCRMRPSFDGHITMGRGSLSILGLFDRVEVNRECEIFTRNEGSC